MHGGALRRLRDIKQGANVAKSIDIALRGATELGEGAIVESAEVAMTFTASVLRLAARVIEGRNRALVELGQLGLILVVLAKRRVQSLFFADFVRARQVTQVGTALGWMILAMDFAKIVIVVGGGHDL